MTAAYQMLSAVALSRRDWDDLNASAERMIAAEPYSADGYLMRASARFAQRNPNPVGGEADLKKAIERIAPSNISYEHDKRWGDGNGFSHVRAALMKPSLTIPLAKGKLTLGTWQQIVFIDFDNRERDRNIVVQVMGE